MKRSGIQRKSWLKRGGPLRPKSKDPKKVARRMQGKSVKDKWRESQPQICWCCGIRPRGGLFLAVHHILRRSHALEHDVPCNFFLICDGPGGCHNAAMHNLQHVDQLAIKQHFDPRDYCLKSWLEMRNKNAMDYVTQHEVDEAHRRLFGSDQLNRLPQLQAE